MLASRARLIAGVGAALAIVAIGVAVFALQSARTSPVGDVALVAPEAVVVLDSERGLVAAGARLDAAALAHGVRQARVHLQAAAATADAVAQTATQPSADQPSDGPDADAVDAAGAQLTASVAGLDTAVARLEGLVAVAVSGGAAIVRDATAAVSGAALITAGMEAESARAALEAAHRGWLAALDAQAAEQARLAEEARASAADPAPGADGRPTDSAGDILWVTSVPTAEGDGSNGHLPMSVMCHIPWGTDQLGYAQYLRCDAADALTGLNDAFRAAFGESIAMDLTYRSYADQVAMKAAFGALAARPGTSSHGLGTALDVQEWPDVYGFGTERYAWLVENGPAHGWHAPARVREDGPHPEYWHFEYAP
ncbi:M15 family metallopeptidase [Cellulomonas cellasea]|uniref:M15 family metallopeptidase n=1 Tax=Cellulomonas cellasea TaxID=43670 RepID=UPI0025A37E72|nr:M15 family metallopeptidase [Cellulomonas cellasea]MDM8084643.1 M15 family metallopeptidase [Cellulomonas cellasea]